MRRVLGPGMIGAALLVLAAPVAADPASAQGAATTPGGAIRVVPNAAAPSEPSPAPRCSPSLKLVEPLALEGKPKSFSYGVNGAAAAGANAEIVAYGNQTLVAFAFAARGGMLTIPALRAGTYEIGPASSGGAKWLGSAPRPTIRVVPSTSVKAKVALRLPCTVDAKPPATTQLVAIGAVSSSFDLTLQSTTNDAATGVTTTTYEGHGLVPSGSIAVVHGAAIPATIYSAPGYEGTAACRAHTRSGGLAARATTIASPARTTLTPSNGAIDLTLTAQPDADSRLVEANIARSVGPGALCPAEP